MATFCSVVNCRRERFERDIGLLLAVWVTRRSVSHVPAEAIQYDVALLDLAAEAIARAVIKWGEP
jgi:hypothetical protein